MGNGCQRRMVFAAALIVVGIAAVIADGVAGASTPDGFRPPSIAQCVCRTGNESTCDPAPTTQLDVVNMTTGCVDRPNGTTVRTPDVLLNCAGENFLCVTMATEPTAELCEQRWASLSFDGRQREAESHAASLETTTIVCGTCQLVGGFFYRVGCSRAGAADALTVTVTGGCSSSACDNCTSVPVATTISRETPSNTSDHKCVSLFPRLPAAAALFGTPLYFAAQCSVVRRVQLSSTGATCAGSLASLPASRFAYTPADSIAYMPSNECVALPPTAGGPGANPRSSGGVAAASCGGYNRPTNSPKQPPVRSNDGEVVGIVMGLVGAIIAVAAVAIVFARRSSANRQERRDAFLRTHELDPDRLEELEDIAGSLHRGGGPDGDIDFDEHFVAGAGGGGSFVVSTVDPDALPDVAPGSDSRRASGIFTGREATAFGAAGGDASPGVPRRRGTSPPTTAAAPPLSPLADDVEPSGDGNDEAMSPRACYDV